MKIKIGTRGSTLALIQAQEAQSAIRSATKIGTEIIKIKTSGDKIKSCSLADIGGKGLFIKEIERALLDYRIDVAVHSLKDIPGQIHPDLTLAGFLKREDPRDVFISCYYNNIESIPKNGVIGTCALRRASQLRGDISAQLLRGNITTRIKKAKNFDGIILALAGLKRINMMQHVTQILPTETMLPAVGQGVICLQCRKDDKDITALLQDITDEKTKIAITAERAFLSTINGDCRTPLAALATITDDNIQLKSMLEVNGKPEFTEETGKITEAYNLGERAAIRLLNKKYNKQ